MKAIINRIGRYFWALLIAIDILANSLIGGHIRETLSGRMGRAIERGDCVFCYFICRKVLHRVDKNHCKRVRSHEKGFVK